MVLEVVGDTLAGNHQVVRLELFSKGLLDIALSGVGKAGGSLRAMVTRRRVLRSAAGCGVPMGTRLSSVQRLSQGGSMRPTGLSQ